MQQPLTYKSHHRQPRNYKINTPTSQIRHQNIYKNQDQYEQQCNPQKDIVTNHKKWIIGKIYTTYDKNTTRNKSQQYKNQKQLKITKNNKLQRKHNNLMQPTWTHQAQKIPPQTSIFAQSLPKLTTLKQKTQVGTQIGHIEHQNIIKHRYLPLKQDNSPQIITQQYSPPQKHHNNLGLSLSGIKRPFNNKIAIQNNQSMFQFQRQISRDMGKVKVSLINQQLMEQKIKKQKIRKQSEQIQEDCVLPFKAKTIRNLKKYISDTANEKWEIRNSNYRHSKNLNSKLSDSKDCQSNKQIKNYGELKIPQGKIIKINYKTMMVSLRDLEQMLDVIIRKCAYIELPEFFLNPPKQFLKLTQDLPIDQITLTNQISLLFHNLDIPTQNFSMKKYTNCLVINNGSICIVWQTHLSNKNKNTNTNINKGLKRYLGGWKNKYFDEGVKDGMGIQWMPGKYVYYGQFSNNKRNGYGLMRDNDGNARLGIWKNGKYQNKNLIQYQ